MKNTNQSAQEVDVEKLAEQYIIDNTTAFDNWKEKAHAAIGFKDGYNQALQSKAVGYSLEDMRKAYRTGFLSDDIKLCDDFIKSLTSTPIQTKGREVEFAEWIEDERWWFEDNRKWHNSKHEQGQTGITTLELFQLFLTTNPSNKGA